MTALAAQTVAITITPFWEGFDAAVRDIRDGRRQRKCSGESDTWRRGYEYGWQTHRDYQDAARNIDASQYELRRKPR